MDQRPLGNTGLRVSAVGFGAWQLGNPLWGGPDEAESLALVHAAVNAGCTFFDTAPGYGGGTSERLLGKALQGRRDKVYLGYSWHVKESRFKEWRSRKKLKEGLDQGMREAGLDYVDLWRISLLVDSHQHTRAELDVVGEQVTSYASGGGS